jgi:hypothetical protein
MLVIGGDAGLERRGGIGCCLLTGTGCVEGGGYLDGIEGAIADVGGAPVQSEEWELA